MLDEAELAEAEISLTEILEDSTLSPEQIDIARRCYSLRLAGNTHEQIGAEIGISRSTVIRRLKDYAELYRNKLSATPQLHLLAEELARLESIETAAREAATTARTDAGKNGFLKTALAALKDRSALLLESGILDKKPTELSISSRLVEEKPEKDPDERTADEIRQDVLSLLKHGRRV